MTKTTKIKKILVLLLAAAMLLSMTGCTSKKAKAQAESAFAADFTDKLYAVSKNYHPGTAGCSLTAACLAAEIMDIFTQSSPSSDVISAAVKEFADTLTGDEAAEFPEQLAAIVSASEELSGEYGKDLLDSCGYAGTGYPWDFAKMAECFAAAVNG